MAELAEVPSGRYRGALLTKDITPIEPDVLEYKLYARGVGPVLTSTGSGGAGREELVRVDRSPDPPGPARSGRPNP